MRLTNLGTDGVSFDWNAGRMVTFNSPMAHRSAPHHVRGAIVVSSNVYGSNSNLANFYLGRPVLTKHLYHDFTGVAYVAVGLSGRVRLSFYVANPRCFLEAWRRLHVGAVTLARDRGHSLPTKTLVGKSWDLERSEKGGQAYRVCKHQGS